MFDQTLWWLNVTTVTKCLASLCTWLVSSPRIARGPRGVFGREQGDNGMSTTKLCLSLTGRLGLSGVRSSTVRRVSPRRLTGGRNVVGSLRQ